MECFHPRADGGDDFFRRNLLQLSLDFCLIIRSCISRLLGYSHQVCFFLGGGSVVKQFYDINGDSLKKTFCRFVSAQQIHLARNQKATGVWFRSVVNCC